MHCNAVWKHVARRSNPYHGPTVAATCALVGLNGAQVFVSCKRRREEERNRANDTGEKVRRVEVKNEARTHDILPSMNTRHIWMKLGVPSSRESAPP